MPATNDSTVDRPRSEIGFLPGAARQLEKLPLVGRSIVVAAIDGLAAEPRPVGAKLLSGTSDERIWRLTAGNYRVLYQVSDSILHRSTAVVPLDI